MTIIHVNFKKNPLESVQSDVVDKLKEWGLDPDQIQVPADALACALDEVRIYETLEARNDVLLQLESLLTS